MFGFLHETNLNRVDTIRPVHGSGRVSFGPTSWALGGGWRDSKPTTHVNQSSQFRVRVELGSV